MREDGNRRARRDRTKISSKESKQEGNAYTEGRGRVNRSKQTVSRKEEEAEKRSKEEQMDKQEEHTY